MNNENEQIERPRFLRVPPCELYQASWRSFIIATLGMVNAMIAPFFATNLWYYLMWWVVTITGVIMLIKNIADYSRVNLLLDYSYLVFSVPQEDNKQQRFFLLDQDHLDDAYKAFGGDNDKIVKENHKLQAQHLMDNKIINGLQKEQHHIAGAYFIFDKDHMFYYDDHLQAIMSFTSRESAQTYVNQYIPDFDGSIMYIPIAIDGEVKSIVKEQDND